jgi:hypothetical protein
MNDGSRGYHISAFGKAFSNLTDEIIESPIVDKSAARNDMGTVRGKVDVSSSLVCDIGKGYRWLDLFMQGASCTKYGTVFRPARTAA